MDIDNQLLVNKMVLRALERMKLINPNDGGYIAPPMSIAKGLTGQGDDLDLERAKFFLDLLTLTDIDNYDPETGMIKAGTKFETDRGMEWASDPRLIASMYDKAGFTGRGTTDEEREELGLTSDYDASPGDIFQNETDNDYQFAKRLLAGDEGKTDTMVAGLGIPGATQATSIKTTPFQRYNAALGHEDRVTNTPQDQNWRRGTGMGRSLADMMDSVTDPSGTWGENVVGRLFSALSDVPNAHVRHSVTGRDESEHGPATVGSFINDAIDPKSEVYQKSAADVDMHHLSKMPSPHIPEEHAGSWQARQRHLADIKEHAENARASEYRDEYKEKYGEYPSYAKEQAVNLGTELADYGAPLSFVLGALTKGPLLAKLASGAGNMVKEFFTEDVPIGGAIQTAGAISSGNMPTTVEGWTSSERIDLPTETDTQFNKRLGEEEKKRRAAGVFSEKYAKPRGLR